MFLFASVLYWIYVFLIYCRSVYSGYKVSLILWGERALAFDGDGVLQLAQKKAVVAIFVGTLVKPYEGQCFNENTFYVGATFPLSFSNLFPSS